MIKILFGENKNGITEMNHRKLVYSRYAAGFVIVFLSSSSEKKLRLQKKVVACYFHF